MTILLVTQGNLARELLASAQSIAGGMEDFRALCLDWDDDPDTAREKLRRELEEGDAEGGVLIMTDMFGSTPCNVAMSFHEPGRVEILAGMNLPMVLRLGCLRRMDLNLEETATWLRDKGRNSICIAGTGEGRCPPKAQPRAPAELQPCGGGEADPEGGAKGGP